MSTKDRIAKIVANRAAFDGVKRPAIDPSKDTQKPSTGSPSKADNTGDPKNVDPNRVAYGASSVAYGASSVAYGASMDDENESPLESHDEFNNAEAMPALDSYEFVWNRDHPLRFQYLDLKRAMYSKYDALNPDNADLKVIIDQTLILQTQITGIGLMLKDNDTTINRRDLSFRLIKNMDQVRENMTLLMKYTRREPEKVLTKNLHDARALGNKFKDALSDSSRAKLSGVIKAMLSSRDTELSPSTMTKLEDRIAVNAIEEEPFGEPED